MYIHVINAIAITIKANFGQGAVPQMWILTSRMGFALQVCYCRKYETNSIFYGTKYNPLHCT